MDEKYSIKEGRTEAVMWIVYKNKELIVEERPADEQGESVCIPCGHIDLNRDKGNYIESAFLREIGEEFKSGEFKPTKYEFLTSVDFDEPNKEGGIDKLRLHYFVVYDWEGEVPDHTVEDGKVHAYLRWVPIDSKLPQSCDRKALEELVKKL